MIKTRRASRLKYGQKSKDVHAALDALRSDDWHFVMAKDVWTKFTPSQRQQWQRAFGKPLSEITSVMWSIANGHVSAGKAKLKKADSFGVYEITNRTPIRPATFPGDLKPEPVSATTTINGVAHLLMVGVDNDNNTLYLDPTSNIVGTLEFIPIGKAR